MTSFDFAKSKNQRKCSTAYKVARDRLEMFSKHKIACAGLSGA